MTAAAQSLSIAYLAKGKLHLWEPGKGARLIESSFVQQMVDRQERNRERHDWKAEGLAWQVTRNPLGIPATDPRLRQVNFAGVSKGAANGPHLELIYALRN